MNKQDLPGNAPASDSGTTPGQDAEHPAQSTDGAGEAAAGQVPLAAPESDAIAIWQWLVLILFSPLAGFVGWLVWRGRQPGKARKAGVVSLIMLALGLFLCPGPTLIKFFVVQPFYIPSGSMEPTLASGDRVLANKFIYRVRDPRPGDLVVFTAPRDLERRDFIKRVVAVGGQAVRVRDGRLYVDGKKVSEPYVAPAPDRSSFGPLTIPKDAVFVMGDNRTNSSDSRVYGPVPKAYITGKAFLVYWPRVRGL